MLGERLGLAEFVAGNTDQVGPEFGTGPAARCRKEEVDRLGPVAARQPEDEPLDPCKLGYMSVYLAYGALRTEAVDTALRFLEREVALAATVPTEHSRTYYRDLLSFVSLLGAILRGVEASIRGGGQKSLDKPLRAYVATRLPEALALTIDLQRAFPKVMPTVLPPADLTEMLGRRALRRLQERDTRIERAASSLQGQVAETVVPGGVNTSATPDW